MNNVALVYSRRRQGWLRRLGLLTVVAALIPVAMVVVPAVSSAAGTLLSQGMATTASSAESGFLPSAATDGNSGTRWSSAFSDPQWLQVDLGTTASINQVVLQWETAYATAFQIQVSPDATNWTSIYSTTTGTGGTQTLNVSGSGRFVRMYGTARATQWGYSLWEFQVYGTAQSSCGTTNAALNQPTTASSAQSGFPPSSATDGNTGTRWSSASSDPQWLQVDLGSSQSICGVQLQWETAYATAYQIQVSPDATNWTNIYTTTTGKGGTEAPSLTGTGRYIRMYGTARGTQWGYSLWEFQVYTVGGGGGGGGSCPWVHSTVPIAQRVAQLMAQMTVDQKISILHGNNSSTPYIGNITGIPSLCIPNLGLQDGPAGVGDGLGGVTQMPSGIVSAATWDPALERQYGAAIGAEFAGKGANVALGPTVNIVRDPRWGRSFETFGEDPYLSGQMAAADIQGIQSQGVLAETKHAAVYNIERPAGTVVVDNRTMQEIYLPAFQTSVTNGATASVMCAYSVVNSIPACQQPYLLNNALYQQAGFGGFVTSDWGGTHSTVESANAGLTVEMPNAYFYADFLKQAVTNGQVSTATLDTMVSRLLTQMFAFGLFDKAPTGSTGAVVTTPAHVAVARQVAEEGIVLLKNNGTLPLSTSNIHSIAVLGVDGGAGVQTIGGGSATVTSSGTVWPLTGIQNRVAGTGITVQYEAASDAAGIQRATTLARNSDVAIVFASDNYGNETSDSTTIDLPGSQNQLISSVASANARTIVVLDTNAASTMPWRNQVGGVFEAFYPGQEIGTAVAELLFGDINPAGKLPLTFPNSLADVPANTPAQWPGANSQVQYSEGVNVGYRWYDSKNVTPLDPFGFGLSYTTFGFSNIQVGPLGPNATATVTGTVTNTGGRRGADVVQLYVGDPASTGEPAHQLKGFQRVDLLPGQSQTVQFTVTAHDLAHWDNTTNRWTTTAGNYQVLIGDSSRNLPLTGSLTVATTLNAAMASPGQTQGAVIVANPHGMSSPAHAKVTLPIQARGVSTRPLTFTASGLPVGLSISADGVISGTATRAGTSTVTVTATDSTGASDSATFVWTTT